MQEEKFNISNLYFSWRYFFYFLFLFLVINFLIYFLVSFGFYSLPWFIVWEQMRGDLLFLFISSFSLAALSSWWFFIIVTRILKTFSDTMVGFLSEMIEKDTRFCEDDQFFKVLLLRKSLETASSKIFNLKNSFETELNKFRTKLEQSQKENHLNDQNYLVFSQKIKKPLLSTQWNLDWLKKMEFGSLNENQKDIIEELWHYNQENLKFLDKLVKVCRLDVKDIFLDVSLIFLPEIIKRIINRELKAEKENKNIIFNENYKKNKKKIKADPQAVSEIIFNLIDNAIKYSKLGEKIEISLEDQKNGVVFKVQDFGIGIPLRDQEMIFTKFFRGSNAILWDASGSGLGLFECFQLVKILKGKIWFESLEGKGTTFYVLFPY